MAAPWAAGGVWPSVGQSVGLERCPGNVCSAVRPITPFRRVTTELLLGCLRQMYSFPIPAIARAVPGDARFFLRRSRCLAAP